MALLLHSIPFYILLLWILPICYGFSEACWGNSVCSGPLKSSFSGPWEKNIFSPSSRVVSPKRLLNEDKDFRSNYPKHAQMNQNGSMVIYDFGQLVGGLVTIDFTATGNGSIGLSFSEAKNFTGFVSDDSNGGSSPDGAIQFDVSSEQPTRGNFTTPLEKLRGGFRYLSIFTLTNSTNFEVNLESVEVNIAFQPSWPNLRAYGGYFHSSDDLLNRIWYASVYTLQANNIPPTSGRVWPAPVDTWSNNATLGAGSSVLVDGAKRDRAVWAGDLGISIPGSLVGLGDLESSKNSLNILYTNQDHNSGELPEVGPPISFFGSDTYHMATLIATYDFILFSNDMDYLESIWSNYTHAMDFIVSKIDHTGLLNVTGTSGWGRSASAAGYSTIGNMLMYKTLKTGASLAMWMKQPKLAKEWEDLAVVLKSQINSAAYNWDSDVGAFKNSNVDQSIFPEDGNSMALYFDGANSSHLAKVSSYLAGNWGPCGAKVPEMPGTISPYVESYEIKGHLKIRETNRALDLIRLSWGWYLNNPMGTESSMIEGYNEDGSFLYTANEGYDHTGSYSSHAHGWSTGPVDALVNYVVGLELQSPGGAKWSFAPQLGDLKFAEGGLTTPLGKFSAGWKIEADGLHLHYNVPSTSEGILQLLSNPSKSIFLNGSKQKAKYSDDDNGLIEISLPGGKHVISQI